MGDKDKQHYAEHSFSPRLLSGLNEMRLSEELCDVTLEISGTKIQAHRNILAGISPYFKIMFTGPFTETGKRCVKIDGVSPSAVTQLVEYCYSGNLLISVDTVQCLFEAASLFQMDSVCEICCDFMTKHITPANCLGIQRFSEVHGFVKLCEKATRHIVDNFSLVTEEEEFFGLELDKLKWLLSNDELEAESEDIILDAALSWLNHDLESRSDLMHEVLSSIRLPLLSNETLVTKLHGNSLFVGRHNCTQLIADAMAYKLLPLDSNKLKGMGMTQARKGRRAIYVLGGIQQRDGSRSSRVQRFDLQKGQWDVVAPMSCPRSGVGVCVAGPYIYAIGGYNGVERVSSGERYDTTTNSWSNIAPMPSCRSSLSLAVYNGFIYALGGRNSSHLRVVERYNVDQNTWQSCPQMIEPRCYPGASAHKNKLYVIGGFQNMSVECFDIELQQWSLITRCCNLPVHNPDGAMIYNGFYIIGGPKDESRPSVDVNVLMAFNEEEQKWKRMVTLQNNGTKTRAVGSKGLLYSFITNEEGLWVECYDPQTKKLTTVTMLPDLALYSGFVLA
ncbi:kelch-like protein diablo [Dysidea avara]|uniref:kelch-like protein diablo n=1 Tax=Dysidea avara TaxID=196820 RepID=UPI00331F05A1